MLRTRYRLIIFLLTLPIYLLINFSTAKSHAAIKPVIPPVYTNKTKLNFLNTSYKDIYMTEVKKYNDHLRQVAQKKRAHQKAIERARRVAKQRRADTAARVSNAASQPSAYPTVGSTGNEYVPGQCVYGVKLWRPEIPGNWHSAYNWLNAAQSIGWPTGATPRLNAVAWLKGGNHVALVISLNPLTIREMNANGPWSINVRTITASDWYYIY